MKFTIILFLVFMLIFTGCAFESTKTDNVLETEKFVKETLMENSVLDTNENTDKSESNLHDVCLYINDKAIVDQRIKMNSEYNNAEIPLLYILSELGAEINWDTEFTVCVKYNDKELKIDTTNEWFGIMPPPGTEHAVRYIDDDELIVDIVSARGILKNMIGVKVYFDEQSIYIRK